MKGDYTSSSLHCSKDENISTNAFYTIIVTNAVDTTDEDIDSPLVSYFLAKVQLVIKLHHLIYCISNVLFI